MSTFDFVVIGGGSGGIAAARRAASYGARVALIEARRLGGTCVNVGCVPKKVMFNAASVAEVLEDAASFGLKAEPSKVDWAGLKQRRDAYVVRLNQIYEHKLREDQITVFNARGRLLGNHSVQVDGMILKSAHILLATGGYPKVPVVPGAQLGITSDGFFELKEQPKRVAMVGTGYVGVELAGILRALGSKVSLFSRYDDVLPHVDAMLHTELRQHMVEAGIEFQPHAEPARVSRSDSGALKVTTLDNRELGGFDSLIWAVGRAPSSAGLGLAAAGVHSDALGFVRVDDYQNTNVQGIYAVGDLTGRAALTPVAIAAGRQLAARLFGNQPDAKVEYENIPTVIFSHPPIGTVGLTETEAKVRYGEGQIKVYTTRFSNLFYGITQRRPATAMKLITTGPDERIVGLHVIGMGADEMLQGFAVALQAGATKATFDRTIAIHPTASEEFVTMREESPPKQQV